MDTTRTVDRPQHGHGCQLRLRPGGWIVGWQDWRRPSCLGHRSSRLCCPLALRGFRRCRGVLHVQSALLAAWIVFWAAMAGIVLLRSGPSSKPAGTSPMGHRWLTASHGISAVVILLLFVLPHIVNHVIGFWSGHAHIELMKAVRYVYRDDIVQPILLALIGFQILSGTVLLRRRLIIPSDFFDTVQTMLRRLHRRLFPRTYDGGVCGAVCRHRHELELVDQ
jgi:hypothetical protein